VRENQVGIWFAMVAEPPKPTTTSPSHTNPVADATESQPVTAESSSQCSNRCGCHAKNTDSDPAADCGECDCGECDCGECDCGECDCEHAGEGLDTSWFDEHAPTVDTPTPDEIVELVVACVNFVRDALGVELDFTPETLPILDHYLVAARETLTERLELRELLWRCAGAYFGELVRRRYNGFWYLPNADVHTWRVNQRRVLLSFNPVGVVAEAMAGSEHGEGPTGALRLAPADQEEIARRLAEIPPLPENEFYLLSTRLEVIDTVVEHLRVRMDQGGQAEFEFDSDDYARDMQPYGVA
jgi:hypothetical protein